MLASKRQLEVAKCTRIVNTSQLFNKNDFSRIKNEYNKVAGWTKMSSQLFGWQSVLMESS